MMMSYDVKIILSVRLIKKKTLSHYLMDLHRLYQDI